MTPRTGGKPSPTGRARRRSAAVRSGPIQLVEWSGPGGVALTSPPVTPETGPHGRILLLRHGETEWSRTGRHTGRTDVPLTDAGRAAARRVRDALALVRNDSPLARVRCSPRTRARDTAELAGLVVDDVDERLAEWDYGDGEGRTTPQIRETVPGWTVWDGPWPGGETADEVCARADAVLADAVSACTAGGDVVLVGHGHFSRVLTARWIGLPASGGVHFRMDPAGVTVLGFERGVPRLDHVNQRPTEHE